MVTWKGRQRPCTPQVHCLGRPLGPSPLLGGYHASPFQEVLGDSLFPTTPQTGVAASVAQMCRAWEEATRQGSGEGGGDGVGGKGGFLHYPGLSGSFMSQPSPDPARASS